MQKWIYLILKIEAINFEREASFLNQTAENFESEAAEIVTEAGYYKRDQRQAQSEIREKGEVEARGHRYQAAVQAYNFDQEGYNFDRQSVFAEYQAGVQSYNFKEEAELSRLAGKSASGWG